MRQIEQDIVQSVRNGTELHVGTSSSYVPISDCYRDSLHFEKEKFTYKLWGNVIATGNTQTKEITVSDCGYATATTVSRLNAMFAGLDIPMVCSIRKKQTVWYVHGREITGIEEAKGMYGEYNINTGTWQVTIA